MIANDFTSILHDEWDYSQFMDLSIFNFLAIEEVCI